MPFKIRHVLIIEDVDSIILGLKTILQDMPYCTAATAKTADEALYSIKKSVETHNPFDLVIADFSFSRNIPGNSPKKEQVFIEKVKELLPNCKIIVYSADRKPYLINNLINKKLINGFIAKDRDSLNLFPRVIKHFEAGNNIYLNQQLHPIMERYNSTDIEEYDVTLLELLASGSTQADISTILKNKGVTSSVSSIEKRINRLKILLAAQNTIHLIAIAKDDGII
ncbi:response regulator transcription factor [Flavobacterium psychrotrophum]|uniref:response regulator transcription factor n=1 Tax=Flavobacterium psychrotrophum TaxID=2294119 RepID=UPI000E311884|nr:response regulator transcription factor [Flavobacterium psychrotrophum]